MPTLDIFREDAFSLTSLTAAILKSKYKPRRIAEMGLFRSKGITTTTAIVEEKDGQLTLIEKSPRGGPSSHIGSSKRTARSFVIPHLERDSTILADEVQNVRAFGSDNAADSVQMLVNERLETLRNMHEATLEHLCAGALKGVILDGDGATTIYNLFTEFGVVQQTAEVNPDSDPRSDVVAILRLIEAELGNEPISGYHAFCGDTFFDTLVEGDDVKETLKYQEGLILRQDLRRGFEFGGVTWENYRGSVGGVGYFNTNEAYVFPIGPQIYDINFAPADYVETVNTIGLPLYAKIAQDPEGLNRFVKVHTQSNPLPICTRPRAVVKVTIGT